jgi:hypothetical protein
MKKEVAGDLLDKKKMSFSTLCLKIQRPRRSSSKDSMTGGGLTGCVRLSVCFASRRTT